MTGENKVLKDAAEQVHVRCFSESRTTRKNSASDEDVHAPSHTVYDTNGWKATGKQS